MSAQPTLPTLEETTEIVADFRKHKTRNLGKMLHVSWRQFVNMAERALAAKGYPDFRVSMMGVLGNLDPEGNTIVELSERTFYTKQAMSKMVRELEEAGYVYTVVHPADKRAQLVRLSARGLQLIQESCSQYGGFRRDFTRVLTEEEENQLFSLMERLVHSNMHLLEPGAPLEPIR